MKTKLLLIMFFILTLLFSCSDNNGCHECEGMSPDYEKRISGMTDYNERARLIQEADECQEIVCDGERYCYKHK